MTPADYLNKMSDIKANATGESFFDRAKGTVTSSLIGGGVGLAIGYFNKYNLIFSAIVGAAIAGFASSYIVNKQ